ncbi:MAG: anaerobic selenocysteine-containing dehydrogenase [Candidatus Pseudothioglobus sp.]|jgi:anaerobic selenocysteine-containing dehydrogenase
MSIEMPSVCPLDCPDTCSLNVTVQDNQVVKVRGSKANPLTNGKVCNKVARFYPDFVHGENRLKTPLRRAGKKGDGQFEAISWDTALDEIHRRFSDIIAEHGAEAIMPYNYAGPHGMLAGGSMDLRFFHQLGATLLDRRPLCGGIKSEAYKGTFGAVPAMQPEQCAHAKLIVVWGNNVTYSNLHLAPLIKKAKANGARLVVIDPKRIKISEQADMYLAVKPGMDLILAWAVAVELEKRGAFDQAFVLQHVLGAEEFMGNARQYTLAESAELCGVSAEEIRAFAALYDQTSPAVISIGNGLERNQNGGNGIRSIFALPALCGKFGVVGGGVMGGSGNAFPKTGAKLTRPDLIPEGTRTLNILDIGRHLVEQDLETPLKGLFIYNHNPVIVSPDQNTLRLGLEREDVFIVGCDVAMTDSMNYADIILPAATHFEHDDLFCAYGQPYLQRAEAVIPLVGEALPNTEIFRRLAQRFGFDDPIFKASDKDLMDDAIDGTDTRLKGFKPSEIPLGDALSMEAKDTSAGDTNQVVLFLNQMPGTPSGKIELKSSYLKDKYGEEIPRYNGVVSDFPLTLISPSSNKMITSTFGGLKVNDETPPLEMNPVDAEARGLENGIRVKVYNALGEVFLPLEITSAVRPGVLCSPKGSWFKTTSNKQTVSALAPTSKADLADGACFNDCRVEVVAAQ